MICRKRDVSSTFVRREDLVDDIEGFPLEIVERMIQCQIDQDNDPDVTVFQRNRWAQGHKFGFTWRDTIEGFNFWNSVIDDKDFSLFFKRYK